MKPRLAQAPLAHAPTVRLVALVALVALVLPAGCREKDGPRGGPSNAASASPSARALARATASGLDASAAARPPQREAGAGALARTEDAGVPLGTCRLVFGPAQQPMTGPGTLVASARGIELVQHRNGVAAVKVFVPSPLPAAAAGAGAGAAKPSTRTPSVDPTEAASRPPCAVAGKYAFCSDAQGNVHKSLREMASDEIVAKAVPGARLSAASAGDERTIVAYVDRRKIDKIERFEAWAKLDGDPPVRVSDEGAGATDVVVAPRRPGEVVAWMIDARVSMTPVHVRTLKVGPKLELGTNAVVHVAGGTSRFLEGALATNDQGLVVGLLAASSEGGFGMLSIPLELGTKEDAPFSFSPYPNGLDGAPLASTRGGRRLVIARVRPSRAPNDVAPVDDAGVALPAHVLELGVLDAAGTFRSMGLVSTQGSVSSVAAETDSFGAVWLHYTDASGSWIERRVCPT